MEKFSRFFAWDQFNDKRIDGSINLNKFTENGLRNHLAIWGTKELIVHALISLALWSQESHLHVISRRDFLQESHMESRYYG